MKKILAAMAFAVVSTTANALTYTFDFVFDSAQLSGVPDSGIPLGWTGVGTFTFEPRSLADATSHPSASETDYTTPVSVTLTGPGKTYNLDFEATARVMQATFGPIHDVIFWYGISNMGFTDLELSGNYSLIPDQALSESNVNLIASHPTQDPNDHVISRFQFPSFIRDASVTNFREAVAPIPEPGEWAMILAGLAIVGTAGRRRISQKLP